ncbi:Hypothetical predicted protein [Paramuricea clavata]|uniref:Uncharacterized protein n=1 Tax=Paramuricea clavata TaxID=317549 RepID=A0A7D9EGC0_PARCT|nr:Hypothetical predicted protein [Paramuricea clavata]
MDEVRDVAPYEEDAEQVGGPEEAVQPLNQQQHQNGMVFDIYLYLILYKNL